MYYFRRNPRIVSTTARINTTIVTAAAITKKIAEKTGIPWPPSPPEKIIKSSKIPIHTKKIPAKSCPGISSSHNSEKPLFRFILSYLPLSFYRFRPLRLSLHFHSDPINLRPALRSGIGEPALLLPIGEIMVVQCSCYLFIP